MRLGQLRQHRVFLWLLILFVKLHQNLVNQVTWGVCKSIKFYITINFGSTITSVCGRCNHVWILSIDWDIALIAQCYTRTVNCLTCIKRFFVLFVLHAEQFVKAIGDVTEGLQLLPVEKCQGRNEVTYESGSSKFHSVGKLANKANQPRIVVDKSENTHELHP